MPRIVKWTIEVLPSARRALRRLPSHLRDEILDALEALEEDPYSLAQPLRGRNDYYRIRFGTHRTIFRISPDKRSVLITRIAHRSDAYAGYTTL